MDPETGSSYFKDDERFDRSLGMVDVSSVGFGDQQHSYMYPNDLNYGSLSLSQQLPNAPRDETPQTLDRTTFTTGSLNHLQSVYSVQGQDDIVANLLLEIYGISNAGLGVIQPSNLYLDGFTTGSGSPWLHSNITNAFAYGRVLSPSALLHQSDFTNIPQAIEYVQTQNMMNKDLPLRTYGINHVEPAFNPSRTYNFDGLDQGGSSSPPSVSGMVMGNHMPFSNAAPRDSFSNFSPQTDRMQGHDGMSTGSTFSMHHLSNISLDISEYGSMHFNEPNWSNPDFRLYGTEMLMSEDVPPPNQTILWNPFSDRLPIAGDIQNATPRALKSDNGSDERSVSGQTVQRRFAISKSDWKTHKPKITFLIERLSLKEVMEIMRRKHNFDASEHQYKYRLGQWGLRKYVTVQDAKDAGQELSERQGKLTDLRVHDRICPQAKVERHRKRHGLKFEALGARPPGYGGSRVRCSTPPLFTLAAPGESADLDVTLRAIRGYCVGGCESGFWDQDGLSLKDPEGRSRGLLYQLSSSWATACQLLEEGNEGMGYKSLRRCSPLFQDLVATESLRLLEHLVHMHNIAIECNMPALAPQLWRWIAHQASSCLQEHHPLCVISRRLATIDTAMPHLNTVMECLIDSVRSLSGTIHKMVIRMTAEWCGETLARQDRPGTLTRLLELEAQCNEAPRIDLIDKIRIKIDIAWQLYQGNQLGEADEGVMRVMAMASSISDDTLRRQTQALARELRALTLCKKESGRRDLEIQHLWQAHKLWVAVWGRSDAEPIRILGRVKSWLTEGNDVEAAAAVKQLWQESPPDLGGVYSQNPE